MKVIVTGGRNYADREKVAAALEALEPEVIIQGGASGADLLAREWGDKNEVQSFTYFAEWEKHGKAAGPIRNHKMLEANQDAVVLAFPGGSGTKHCKETAIGLGMLVLEVK